LREFYPLAELIVVVNETVMRIKHSLLIS